MTIFILVLVTLSLLGSVLWIMPSQKERAKMALRMEARKHSLLVQFTHLDFPDKWDKTKEKRSVVAYHRHREKKLKPEPEAVRLYPYEVWKHPEVAEGWWASRELSLLEEVVTLLEENQQRFDALEISAHSVVLYWREQGEMKHITQIARLLELLEQQDI